MIPTLASSTSTIGYSITRPKTRKSVVTKPKYSLAVISGWRSGDEKLSRNVEANGRIT